MGCFGITFVGYIKGGQLPCNRHSGPGFWAGAETICNRNLPAAYSAVRKASAYNFRFSVFACSRFAAHVHRHTNTRKQLC